MRWGWHQRRFKTARAQHIPKPALWNQSWEDDLIMTGVRSFDVKAYDNALAATPTWAGETTSGCICLTSTVPDFSFRPTAGINTPGTSNVPLELGRNHFPIPPPVTLWPPIVPQTGLSVASRRNVLFDDQPDLRS